MYAAIPELAASVVTAVPVLLTGTAVTSIQTRMSHCRNLSDSDAPALALRCYLSRKIHRSSSCSDDPADRRLMYVDEMRVALPFSSHEMAMGKNPVDGVTEAHSTDVKKIQSLEEAVEAVDTAAAGVQSESEQELPKSHWAEDDALNDARSGVADILPEQHKDAHSLLMSESCDLLNTDGAKGEQHLDLA